MKEKKKGENKENRVMNRVRDKGEEEKIKREREMKKENRR